MIRRALVAFAAAAFAALLADAPVVAQSVPRPSVELAEYLVTLAPGADKKTVREVYGRFGIKSIKPLPNDVYLVTITHDPGLAAMEKAREANDLVRAVQRNQRYRRY